MSSQRETNENKANEATSNPEVRRQEQSQQSAHGMSQNAGQSSGMAG
jgi:hypothetical protein